MSAIKSLALVFAPQTTGLVHEANQAACYEQYSDGSILFAVASGNEATWVAESFIESMKDIKDRSGKPFANVPPPNEIRPKWLGMVYDQCSSFLEAVGQEEDIDYDLNVVWGVISPHGWGMAGSIGKAPTLHGANWDAQHTCALNGDVYISSGNECPKAEEVLSLLNKKGEEQAAITLDSKIKAKDYCALFAAVMPQPASIAETPKPAPSKPVIIQEKKMTELELALAELKAAEAEVAQTRAALALAMQEHENAIAHLALCQDRYNKLEAAPSTEVTALVWVSPGEGHCRTLGNHCENIGILPEFQYEVIETTTSEAYDFSADFEAFNKLAEALSCFEVVTPEIETLDKDAEEEEAYYELLAAEEMVEQTAQAVINSEAAVKTAEAKYEAALALVKELEAGAKAVLVPTAAPVITAATTTNVSVLVPTSKVPAVRGVQVRAIKLYEANGASVSADKAIAEVLAATNSAVAMTAMKQLEAAYGMSSSNAGKQVLSDRDED